MTSEDKVEAIQEQIHRYFMAVYGKNYAYAAPETYPNVLEQWMLSVASGNMEYADELMTRIEEMAVEQNDLYED